MAIKKHLKIYLNLAKFSAMTEMEYRFSFFLEWFVEFAYIIVSMFAFRVLFWNVREFAGWDFNRLLVLIGINVIFSEIILGLSFIFNLRNLPEKIQKGDLDLFLTKPINSQFAASLWRPYFALVPALIPGIFFIWLGFRWGGFVFNPVWLVPFSVIFISGLVIAYSVGVMISALSFWLLNAPSVPKLAEQVLRLSQNPFNIYNPFWKIVFLLILPLAFMVTFPAQALMGMSEWWWPLLAVFLATVFLKASNVFWNFGLKHYQSASS